MSTRNSKTGWALFLSLGALAMVAILVALFGVADTALAQTGEIGQVCLETGQPGAVCTANDVRLEELRVAVLVNGCSEVPTDTMTAVFEALVQSRSTGPSPNRYDIGFFIALDGGDAKDPAGDCFHGYLAPPLTDTPVYADWNMDGISDTYNMDPNFAGWWDGEVGVVPPDTCGDIEQDTQVIGRLGVPLTIPCLDVDGDQYVDVGVCTSWDNNVNTECISVTQAYPSTKSKCSCQRINLPNQITAIELASFTAAPQGDDILLTWETANEIDNVGFNVYRAESLGGQRSQLNGSLIPSQVPGSAVGAVYTWLDEGVAPDTTYYYWLEDVDTSGLASLTGPVSARVEAAEQPPEEPPPAVPEASTLLLLGSAATGLAGYIGLQIRARRRK